MLTTEEFKQFIEFWKAGKINHIYNEISEDQESFKSADYYPEEDVTIYCNNIFEEYYYDDIIQIFDGVCKGRGDISELIEEALKYYDD